MTYRTGSNTYIGVQMTSVWSQAVAAGVGDQWQVENFAYNENPETLVANPIGSGSEMINESTKGATSPSIDASGIGQFAGVPVRREALLFGTSYGPFSTAAATAFTHSLVYNSSRPAKYACIGWHTSSNTSMEIPSSLPSRLRVSAANPPAYEMREFSLLGDNVVITGAANTVATLATTTMESTKRVVARPTDYFRLNAQAGAALASSDNVSITSFDITYDRALEHVREIRGAADTANAEPRQASSPPFGETLSVTLRSAADHTYWPVFSEQAAVPCRAP